LLFERKFSLTALMLEAKPDLPKLPQRSDDQDDKDEADRRDEHKRVDI
jgi:hypothetical protein